MEQTGEQRIAASRDRVWAALNDPDVLARCLDGCLAMDKVADDRFLAKVKARVGPVRATFDADLTLRDVDPPNGYIIDGNVKGGPAGFARGSAKVDLADDGEQTRLAYAVTASVGGKLAQVGSRLIDGTARKMADDFFAQFRRELEGPEVTEPPAPDTAEAPGPQAGAGGAPDRSYEAGGRWMIWLAVFAALLLALVFAF